MPPVKPSRSPTELPEILAQRLPVVEQHAPGGHQAGRSEGKGFFIHREIVLDSLIRACR
jgi:hypothetical protein